MEGQPVDEAHPRDGDGAELQAAIDGIDRELVLDKEVGDEHLILPPTRATAGNLDHLRTLHGQRIERLASSAGTEEKSPQESRTGEGEQSRVHPCRRSESGGDLHLLPVGNAHDGQLAQEFEVSRLHDEAALLSDACLSSSHGAPRRLCE